jgi:hypothetical protein
MVPGRAGQDAEVIACDALIVPVVTGSPDWNVIGQIITLVPDAHGHHGHDERPSRPARPGDPARPAHPARPAQPGGAAAPLWLRALPAQAQEELLHALARLAIDFVSGPGGVASALRRTLLGAQLTPKASPSTSATPTTFPTPSAAPSPAATSTAPGRRLRPPRRRLRRPPHHPQKDGGATSVKDCILLCQYHHDICVHRWGWKIELLPD